MGTRMILYEIAKKDWWRFATAAVGFYETSWQMEYFNELKKTKDFERIIKWINDPNNHIEFQVFEDGNYYYFRVLEAGYFFFNHSIEFPELKLHFYDDHSDIDEEMEKEKKLVEWVDLQIQYRYYFLYPVLSSDSYEF